MANPNRKVLLQLMDDTRAKIEGLLPQIDNSKEIYPGWTIRELLAHVTGWDEVSIDTLRAHSNDQIFSGRKIRNLNQFNANSISARAGLEFIQILEEWRSTRQVLRKLIEEFPEKKFNSPFPVPWGGKSTLTDMMEMFCEHEESHTQDVQQWLQHAEKPIMQEGE